MLTHFYETAFTTLRAVAGRNYTFANVKKWMEAAGDKNEKNLRLMVCLLGLLPTREKEAKRLVSLRKRFVAQYVPEIGAIYEVKWPVRDPEKFIYEIIKLKDAGYFPGCSNQLLAQRIYHHFSLGLTYRQIELIINRIYYY